MMKEEKKQSRSEKRYANSPKMERGEDGAMKVNKNERKAAATNAGTDNAAHGADMPDKEMSEMMHRHSEERMKMHHKHETEMMEHMHKKSSAMHEESMDKKEHPEVERGKDSKKEKEPKKESGKEEMTKVKGDK